VYIVVFSDIHALLPAYNALQTELEQLREHGIDVARLWFLGDTLGYGPQPLDVLLKMYELLGQHSNHIALLGNHDKGVLDILDGVANTSIVFDNQRITNTLFKDHGLTHIQKHAPQLNASHASVKWLKTLKPQAIPFKKAGYFLAHGQFMWEDQSEIDRLWTYGTENSTKRQIQISRMIKENPTPKIPVRLVMNGHHHVVGLWRVTITDTSIIEEEFTDLRVGTWQEFDNLSARPIMLNVGSISLPRGAGHLPCATYVILDVDETNYDTIRLQFRTLQYDTSELLNKRGRMPIGYAGRGILREQIQRTLDCQSNYEEEA